MLWLVIEGASHQIISCNIHKDGALYQLWIERPNGKSLKVIESKDYTDVEEVKSAIDFAIEHKEPSLRL